MAKYIYILILFSFSATFGNSFEDLGEGILIQRNKNFCNQEKKIAIVTVIISGKQQENSEGYKSFQYKDVVAFGTRSKELYAKKHGYDFIIGTKKINDCYGVKATRNLECAWTKLPVISKVLEDYDWVFFSDADSIILNFNKKVEDFLNEDFDFIVCSANSDFTEPRPYIEDKINTGQVFYKNCEFCKELILGAWNNHHKKELKGFEQSRIIHYIQSTKSGNHVLVYPRKAFNARPRQYEPEDFLVHMACIHGRELYSIFKTFEKKYGWILEEEERQ